MKTSKKRVINVILCTIAAIILNVAVVSHWSSNNLGTACLVLGVLMYTVCCAFFAVIIDMAIKDNVSIKGIIMYVYNYIKNEQKNKK